MFGHTCPTKKKLKKISVDDRNNMDETTPVRFRRKEDNPDNYTDITDKMIERWTKNRRRHEYKEIGVSPFTFRKFLCIICKGIECLALSMFAGEVFGFYCHGSNEMFRSLIFKGGGRSKCYIRQNICFCHSSCSCTFTFRQFILQYIQGTCLGFILTKER